MYAVIELQGHQYIIQKGEQIIVDKLPDAKDGGKYTVDTVLAVFDEKGDNVTVGKPYIAKASVECKIITAEQKGDKVKVLKFKNKNRYERNYGFKPHQTVLEIKKIALDE